MPSTFVSGLHFGENKEQKLGIFMFMFKGSTQDRPRFCRRDETFTVVSASMQ